MLVVWFTRVVNTSRDQEWSAVDPYAERCPARTQKQSSTSVEIMRSKRSGKRSTECRYVVHVLASK